MEKQLRDEKNRSPRSIVNTVKILPQNNNNNIALVCIPHTLMAHFLIHLISVVVVCVLGLVFHFKFWESFWYSIYHLVLCQCFFPVGETRILRPHALD